MRGKARRVVWNADDKLMARIASHLAGGKSCSGATNWMPALLTRTSSRPNDASVASIISAIDAGLDMSAAEYCTVTPNSSASLAWVAVISSGFPKPLSTTADPAAARARAMPRPIPLVEPVISDTRPESGRAAASSLSVRGLFMTWLRG